MKQLIFLTVIFLFLSCSKEQKHVAKTLALAENTAYGNIKLKEKFEKYYPNIKTSWDSVSRQTFLKQPLNAVNCKANKRFDDFYDYNNVYYRKKEFTINDTIVVTILEKQDKGSQYLYLCEGKPFNIINYTDGEFNTPKTDYHFFLEERECWQLSKNKYLMAETPSGWCGTILQFEFYQVFDLDKMEITQFVDKRL